MTTINEAAAMLGRKGGSSKSARKAEASRRNGKLGGRKTAPAIVAVGAPVPVLIAAQPKEPQQ